MLGRIWRKIRTASIGRLLVSYGKRLRIPHPVLRFVVKVIKIGLFPGEFMQRWLASGVVARDALHELRIDATKGYGRISGTNVSEIAPAVAACRRIFEERRATAQFQAGKPYRATLLCKEDLEAHPELLRLGLSPPIVSAVTQYLGTVPILATMSLWWSSVNDTTVAAQLFHLDSHDFRLAKVFINVTDVDQGCGPVTFVTADVSSRIRRGVPEPLGRVADELVYRFAKPDDVIVNTSLAEQGVVVDTCRCYHYGSRSRSGDRLQLVLNYIGWHQILEIHDPLEISRHARHGTTKIQRMVLGQR